MAVRKILQHPDPRLRTIARPVGEITPEIQKLIDDLFDTLHQYLGAGLAATQINEHRRILLVNPTRGEWAPQLFINPELSEHEEQVLMSEGCLSLPDVYIKVPRYKRVTINARNRDGEQLTIKADGLLAHCIQHEADHLDGKLAIDYLSSFKQKRIMNKLKKRLRTEV